ncbi:TetR/AcrR family transcriptional regulator [Nocardia cyriacigeorgica]|uniref:TetR/AcrR family transcriptional regulator n=1 Tax=Nocardia cyriacigeorgica TaxID=135487 RepID=UPI002453AF3B|nr:TetR/AcrR family transcriptional regulator [Nocardia cyriacigeorgica]
MTRAFQRLLAAEGLHRVTFSKVASEAGISVGLIQHYFTNKDELLRFSYDDCLRRSADRVATHIREGEAAGQPISTMLRAALAELLPLDAERIVEYRVERSLWNLSLNDPDLAEAARAAHRELHDRIATAIDNGKECGEVRTDVDSSAAAAMITAATRGLADALSIESRVDAGQLIDAVLLPVISIVFTGRCRRFED